jgi:hypothetical protein
MNNLAPIPQISLIFHRNWIILQLGASSIPCPLRPLRNVHPAPPVQGATQSVHCAAGERPGAVPSACPERLHRRTGPPSRRPRAVLRRMSANDQGVGAPSAAELRQSRRRIKRLVVLSDGTWQTPENKIRTLRVPTRRRRGRWPPLRVPEPPC